MLDRPATRVTDLAAATAVLALLALLAGAGGLTTADGRGAMALTAAAAGTYVAARSVPAGVRVPLLGGLLGGIVATVVAAPDILSGAPQAEPLGYGNANGALLGLGVVTAAGLVTITTGAWRLAAATAGLLLLVSLPATRSAAATALGVAAVVGIAVATRSSLAAKGVAAIAAVLTLAVVAGTVLLGAGYGGPGSEAAAEALSSRRVELWRDAVDITVDHPARGAGLGSFPRLSETARRDLDTQLPHSLALELSAEAGVAAAMAAVVTLLLLAVRPVLGPVGPLAVVGTFTVVAFATQSAVDYTHHFVPVVLTAAAIAGLSTSPSVRPGENARTDRRVHDTLWPQ